MKKKKKLELIGPREQRRLQAVIHACVAAADALIYLVLTHSSCGENLCRRMNRWELFRVCSRDAGDGEMWLEEKKFRRSERSVFPWHHLALLKSQKRERERESLYWYHHHRLLFYKCIYRPLLYLPCPKPAATWRDAVCLPISNSSSNVSGSCRAYQKRKKLVCPQKI